MATKSFLKTIHTISADNAEQLADAFEKAGAFPGKKVKLSHPVVEVKGKDVKTFFARRYLA
ncbi:MAG: hypothetical protein IJS96_03050 [Schwartzia sp.]|nr:hypothetical protein [Schwartzia sp. (in: firmicutes)]